LLACSRHKKVNPVYPADARSEYIQDTVVLQAEISKTGDIANLELVDGPIELAGCGRSASMEVQALPANGTGRNADTG